MEEDGSDVPPVATQQNIFKRNAGSSISDKVTTGLKCSSTSSKAAWQGTPLPLRNRSKSSRNDNTFTPCAAITEVYRGGSLMLRRGARFSKDLMRFDQTSDKSTWAPPSKHCANYKYIIYRFLECIQRTILTFVKVNPFAHGRLKPERNAFHSGCSSRSGPTMARWSIWAAIMACISGVRSRSIPA